MYFLGSLARSRGFLNELTRLLFQNDYSSAHLNARYYASNSKKTGLQAEFRDSRLILLGAETKSFGRNVRSANTE